MTSKPDKILYVHTNGPFAADEAEGLTELFGAASCEAATSMLSALPLIRSAAIAKSLPTIVVIRDKPSLGRVQQGSRVIQEMSALIDAMMAVDKEKKRRIFGDDATAYLDILREKLPGLSARFFIATGDRSFNRNDITRLKRQRPDPGLISFDDMVDARFLHEPKCV